VPHHVPLDHFVGSVSCPILQSGRSICRLAMRRACCPANVCLNGMPLSYAHESSCMLVHDRVIATMMKLLLLMFTYSNIACSRPLYAQACAS
jgi:hypothetical protein